jgi:gamma-glutamylcyclotransferase (GGCT)/AIG2-like uncharacterized protein YtfP
VKVIGRKIKGISDSLKGYAISEIKIGRFPTIIKKKNSSVNGLVLSIASKELKLVDIYESEYQRKTVILNSGKRAWTYIEH